VKPENMSTRDKFNKREKTKAWEESKKNRQLDKQTSNKQSTKNIKNKGKESTQVEFTERQSISFTLFKSKVDFIYYKLIYLFMYATSSK
jgi:hypothetical protein